MAFNAVATHNPFYIFHILARKTCNSKTASIPGPLTILKKNKPKNKHGGRKHMLEVLRQNFELLSRSQQKRFAPDGFRIYGACVLFGHVFTSALYLRCTSCSALRKWIEVKEYFSNLCQYCSVTSHVQDVITQRFPAFWRDKSTGLLGIG